MECGCYDFGDFLSCDDIVLDLQIDFDGDVQVELLSALGRSVHQQTVADGEDFTLEATLNEAMAYEMMIRDQFGVLHTITVDGLEYQCFRFKIVPVHVRI